MIFLQKIRNLKYFQEKSRNFEKFISKYMNDKYDIFSFTISDEFLVSSEKNPEFSGKYAEIITQVLEKDPVLEWSFDRNIDLHLYENYNNVSIEPIDRFSIYAFCSVEFGKIELKKSAYSVPLNINDKFSILKLWTIESWLKQKIFVLEKIAIGDNANLALENAKIQIKIDTLYQKIFEEFLNYINSNFSYSYKNDELISISGEESDEELKNIKRYVHSVYYKNICIDHEFNYKIVNCLIKSFIEKYCPMLTMYSHTFTKIVNSDRCIYPTYNRKFSSVLNEEFFIYNSDFENVQKIKNFQNFENLDDVYKNFPKLEKCNIFQEEININLYKNIKLIDVEKHRDSLIQKLV